MPAHPPPLRPHLASQGNRDERLKQAKAAIASAEKESKGSAKALATAQQAQQKLTLQLESMEANIGALPEGRLGARAELLGLTTSGLGCGSP